ncbi:MAG: SAM-dependent methyltransferase [Sedimentisphaerales bacterium]
MMKKEHRIEFGDYQTPQSLADQVLAFLATQGLNPAAIVEPTCGSGTFVKAAAHSCPSAEIFAFDLDRKYTKRLVKISDSFRDRLHVEDQDFFDKDWKTFFDSLNGEILVVGNPPWVTNASLGTIHGKNFPKKSNFQNHKGFAAKTGKANFDISEWILIKLLESLGCHCACVAMLCKTATARKVLKHAWTNCFPIGRASLHTIDAKSHFQVAVDACLFIVHTGTLDLSMTATVYRDISFNAKSSTIGMHGKELVSDVDEFKRLSDIDGISHYKWRSGVKHDAARVMEFTRKGNLLINTAGEEVDIEDEYLFPMLKSSDLANGEIHPKRLVLLTQRHPGDDTSNILVDAPATWRYLSSHGPALDARQSIIYKKRSRFAIFGVGTYTFAPWKVAISGLYKTLKFRVVGSSGGKPIVVDDTCYFIPCHTRQESEFICELLNSDLCQRFLRSIVFLDSKRPITIDVLNRIDLRRLAEKLGQEVEAREFLLTARHFEHEQPLLFL